MIRLSFIALFLPVVTSGLLQAQTTALSSEGYEELPVLKASDILRDDVIAGPSYRIREEVPTGSGANHFIIDSEFGVFEAEGNEELVTRIGEINAIARLKEVSRSDEYKPRW